MNVSNDSGAGVLAISIGMTEAALIISDITCYHASGKRDDGRCARELVCLFVFLFVCLFVCVCVCGLCVLCVCVCCLLCVCVCVVCVCVCVCVCRPHLEHPGRHL